MSLDAGSNTVRNANSGSARGIVAQGPLSVTAGALVNRGNVSSNGDISLKITGLDNDAGVIGANGKLTVEGSAVSNRGGSLQARQGVDLQVGGGSVDNSAGLMRSDGTVNVQAGTVRNDSTQGQNQGMEGATVSVSAADISIRAGQEVVTKGKSGCVGDDGGHLIASSLDGAGDRINTVPQASTLNPGDWRAMEDYLRSELQDGKSVDISIDVKYDVSSIRLNEFTVRAKIDAKSVPFRFQQ